MVKPAPCDNTTAPPYANVDHAKARLLLKTVEGGLTLLDDIVGTVLGPIPIGDVTVNVLTNHEFALSNSHWTYHLVPGTYRSADDGNRRTRHR